MTLSNVGKQEALINKFSNTRSIQAVACRDWNTEVEIIADIRSMENQMMTHILQRLPDPRLREINSSTCLTQLAQMLREIGRGLQLEGVTMAAQQDQVRVCRWEDVPIESYNQTVSLVIRGDPSVDWSLSRGPVTPYIGAPTKVRSKRQPLEDTESYSFTQALTQALQLRSWVKGDACMVTLFTLLDRIIQEKSNASEEELNRRTAHVYSGTITHRLPCPTMNRGGQSNSTSNFAAHVNICSSTATDFAKKGKDYTLCFQSIFLYSLATLSLYYKELGSLPDRMAAVIHAGCCVWTIPPESFELDQVTYRGVEIPTAMVALQTTEDRMRSLPSRTAGVQESYTAHIAYKFAVWILNRRESSAISALERRALDEVTTPPFVNLSETCRLDLRTFFQMLTTYLLLMDTSMRRDPSTILNELRKSRSRTGLDDLIDTILLSGLTHSFCLVTCSSVLDLEDKEGWRVALSNHIQDIYFSGTTSLLLSWTILLPEEEDHMLRQWVRTLALVNQLFVPGQLGSYQEIVETVALLKPQIIARHKRFNYPAYALSEEESIAGIRKLSRPSHRQIERLPEPTHPLEPAMAGSSINRDMEEIAWCIQGGQVANQLYEVLVTLRQRSPDLGGAGVHLVTLSDEGGLLYSIMAHMFPKAVKSGFPHWHPSGAAVMMALEMGPKYVTGDPCDIPYDHTEFLANLGQNSALRLKDPQHPIFWILAWPERVVGLLPDIKGHILLVRESPQITIGHPWRLCLEIEFQQVQGCDNRLWRLYTLEDLSPEYVSLGLGRSNYASAMRRPLSVVMYMQTVRMACLSPVSSLLHFLQGCPSDMKRLERMTRRVLAGLVERLPPPIVTGDPRGEILQERDSEIRSEVNEGVAIIALIRGLMNPAAKGFPLKDGSYVKFHYHYGRNRKRVCQGRCPDAPDRGPDFSRGYGAASMRRWWRSAVLLIGSLGGTYSGALEPPVAFILRLGD